MPSAGCVCIKVDNTNGQLVKTILDRHVENDWHDVQFSGIDDNNQTIANGVYFYRIETGDFIDIKNCLFYIQGKFSHIRETC